MKYYNMNFNYSYLSNNYGCLLDIYLVPVNTIRKKKIHFLRKDGVTKQTYDIISKCGSHDAHNAHKFCGTTNFGFVFVWRHPKYGILCHHFCVNETDWKTPFKNYEIVHRRRL